MQVCPAGNVTLPICMVVRTRARHVLQVYIGNEGIEEVTHVPHTLSSRTERRRVRAKTLPSAAHVRKIGQYVHKADNISEWNKTQAHRQKRGGCFSVPPHFPTKLDASAGRQWALFHYEESLHLRNDNDVHANREPQQKVRLTMVDGCVGRCIFQTVLQVVVPWLPVKRRGRQQHLAQLVARQGPRVEVDVRRDSYGSTGVNAEKVLKAREAAPLCKTPDLLMWQVRHLPSTRSGHVVAVTRAAVGEATPATALGCCARFFAQLRVPLQYCYRPLRPPHQLSSVALSLVRSRVLPLVGLVTALVRACVGV